MNIQDHLQSIQQPPRTTILTTNSDNYPTDLSCQPAECGNPTLWRLSSQLDVLGFGDASSTSVDPDFITDSCRSTTFRCLSELGRPDSSLESETGSHRDSWFHRTLSLANFPSTALPNFICNDRIFGGDSIDPTALISVQDISLYENERGNKAEKTCTDIVSNSTFDAQLPLLQLDGSDQAIATSGRAPSRVGSGVIDTFTTTQTQLPSVRLPVRTDNICSGQSRAHYRLPTKGLEPRLPYSSVNIDIYPTRSRESLLSPWPQGKQPGFPQDSSPVMDVAQNNITAERPELLGRGGLAGKACPQEELPPNSQRSNQDQFLVRSKLSGMSYKEIKVKGHFKEAESTLRGRFRTLTKSKESRVRKPHWHDKDVSFDAIASDPALSPFTD